MDFIKSVSLVGVGFVAGVAAASKVYEKDQLEFYTRVKALADEKILDAKAIVAADRAKRNQEIVESDDEDFFDDDFEDIEVIEATVVTADEKEA